MVKKSTKRTVVKNGKIYDLQSPNKSFLLLARDLKTLGVKNWYFFLEVKDRSVLSIDPYQHDDNDRCTLTKDQVARVLTECRTNPWYFIREVVRLKSSGGPTVMYKANRGNIAQSWCLLNGLDSYLVLPRQQGKTMTAIVLIAWAMLFGTTDSNFVFLAQNAGKTKDNLNRVKDVIDSLPEYMRHEHIVEDGKMTKAIKNATKLKDPVTRNTIITTGGASSEEAAMNVARGLSSSILYFDEPEFTKYLPIIIANTYPAFSKTAEIAKQNKSIYGRIFTSTPGDLGTKTGTDAMKFVNGTIQWTDKMYDWGPDKTREYIKSQGDKSETPNNGVIYIQFYYYQLGLTREWADKQLVGTNNNMIVFRREVLLQRMNGSDDFPYDKEDLAIIESNKGKVIDELFLQDFYMFKIYRHLNSSLPYLVGIDCATGTNGDNNAITIINPKDLKVDAEFSCGFIGETKLENLIIELCSIIPRAVIIIERNHVGDGILDHLLHSKIRDNLYYDKAKDLLSEKNKIYESVDSLLKKQATIKKFYGVHTNKSSREDMFKILAMRIKENQEDFVGENLIKDIGSLVIKGKRVEAGPGAHDDSIMSYLIAMYVYYYGNNLEIFGVTRAADKEDLDNSGINIGIMDTASKLDRDTIAIIKDIEEKEKKTNEIFDWCNDLKKSAIESNIENRRLINSGFLKDNTKYSDENAINNSSTFGTIPMSFFDDINGI